MNDNLIENLKILVWLVKRDHKYKLSIDEAVIEFAKKTNIAKDRIWQLLKEEVKPDEFELKQITESFDYDEEEILTGRLYDELGIDILKENMRYLLSSLPHGEKTELAKEIGTDLSTVQRWQAMQTAPSRRNIEKLQAYFQLDGDEDLNRTPLFLSLEPIGVKQKKDYCIEQIKDMSVQEFSAVYHALDKLIK